MSYKLVTVARFSTPSEASIARNVLDSDGVRAFLADDATVGMAWHLGAAIGGIKLQVSEDDVERAIALLEANDPTPITDDDWNSVEAGDRTEPEVRRDRPATPTSEMVSRAFRAAVIGLFFLPLQLYSLWLLLCLMFGTAVLSAADRRKVLMTLIVDLPVVLICAFLLWSMFSQ